MRGGKVARQVTVIIVMVTGVLFCVGLWIGYAQDHMMIVPAVGFTGVYLWFIAMEIWGVLRGGQTLSKRLSNWIEAHPWLGYPTLAMFAISMTALAIHFGWVGN